MAGYSQYDRAARALNAPGRIKTYQEQQSKAGWDALRKMTEAGLNSEQIKGLGGMAAANAEHARAAAIVRRLNRGAQGTKYGAPKESALHHFANAADHAIGDPAEKVVNAAGRAAASGYHWLTTSKGAAARRRRRNAGRSKNSRDIPG